MRLIKIDKGSMKTTYTTGIKSVNNIRQMLLRAGYTKDQIAELRSKDLILLSPGTLSRTLKTKDTLYILDPEEPIEAPKSLDRFEDL